MVDVAEELGVDAIGLNHLMFSTPEEVAETVRLIGAADASVDRDVRHAGPRTRRRHASAQKVAALQEKCRERNVLFDFRPKVHPQLIDNYYTPGAKLEGRCLYPFLHARVSFSGKVYFCPFIRVEVGDLAKLVARGDLERRALRRYAETPGRERHFSGVPPLLQGRTVARSRSPSLSGPVCRARRGARSP